MGGCGRSGHAEELRGLQCYGGGGVDCVLRRYDGALGFKGGRGEEDKSGRVVRRGPLGGEEDKSGRGNFYAGGFWAHLSVAVG